MTPPGALSERALQQTQRIGRETMDPKSTAVVLIEYQNDFTSDGGTLHQAVKPVMDTSNMLANTVETVKQARALAPQLSTRRSRSPTTITN
jgi:hypothetical protein